MAQWLVQSVPELDGRSITALAEVSCGGNRQLLIGTNEGLFVDYTGRGIGGQWITANIGLPTSGGRALPIREIVIKDSLVLASVENQGIYVALLSNTVQPLCRLTSWVRLGANTPTRVNDIVVASGNRVYAATSQGVWLLQPRLSTNGTLTQDATNASLNTWRNLDASLTDEVNMLAIRENLELLAGTRFNGVMTYSLTCPTTATCTFTRTSSTAPMNRLTITHVQNIRLDTIFRQVNNFFVPCVGAIMANTSTDNLYFAPISSNATVNLNAWINITPAQTNPRFTQKINTIMSGSFPGLSNALIVGTELGGVLVSDDCGRTWREMNMGLATSPGGLTGLAGSDVRTLNVIRDTLLVAGAYNTLAIVGGAMAQLPTRSASRTITSVRTSQSKVSSQIADTTGDGSLLNVVSIPGTDRIKVFVRVPKSQTITLTVFSMLATKVRDLFTGTAQAGMNEFEFDLTSLANGAYFCRVSGATINKSQRFMLVH